MKHLIKISYFGILSFLLFSTNANAYIDPSVATYLIQAIAGIGVTIGVLITVFRHKIMRFFRELKYKNKKKK